jgi:DNA polymerase II large subunit
MLVAVTAAIVAAIVLVSVGLSIAQFRKITPLAFRCLRCGAVFHQPPHLPSPGSCPRCGATDWAT